MKHFRTTPKCGGGGLLTKSYPTLCDPTDCSPPGSSVHGFPSPGPQSVANDTITRQLCSYSWSTDMSQTHWSLCGSPLVPLHLHPHQATTLWILCFWFSCIFLCFSYIITYPYYSPLQKWCYSDLVATCHFHPSGWNELLDMMIHAALTLRHITIVFVGPSFCTSHVFRCLTCLHVRNLRNKIIFIPTSQIWKQRHRKVKWQTWVT